MNAKKRFYEGQKVAVTGGASFIGSHLANKLVEQSAEVTVLDDLSSGRPENLQHDIELVEVDLANPESAQKELAGFETVFHLAAVHGGRGFIESKEAEITKNFAIDHSVFQACKGARMVVHASSACAYPTSLQGAESKSEWVFLEENSIDFDRPETLSPDGIYGWTKLIGERQLRTFAERGDFLGRSARIFTAYGERENESHAAIALSSKALLRMDPFEIWGSGNQTRNFTYVQDTVAGLLELGADEGDAFDVFNIGTARHETVNEFVEVLFGIIQWHPNEIFRDTSKPAGVASRASNNSKFRSKFGWEPEISILEGLQKTVDWLANSGNLATSLPELVERLNAR